MNQDLSERKTLITNPRKKAALFLGTLLSISSHVNFVGGKQGQRIKAVSQVVMNTPLDRVYNKLAEAGFLDLNSKVGLPRFL